MLTIFSWGGIGDTLRNISLVPHQFLYRRFGIRSSVVYIHWKKIGILEHAHPPEAPFFEQLIRRCPSLRWDGEVEGRAGAGRLVNRGLRDAIRLLNGNTPWYFPFQLQLTPEESAALPMKLPGRFIGIQTHLSGMLTKQWGLENWRAYLDLLLVEAPNSNILLFDTDPKVELLCDRPNIQTTRSLNIAQSISLIERLDLLISVDSWSKYVGAWNRIPQLIIVPDQRPEYPGLSAEKLVRDEFAGIFGAPRTKVLGIGGTKAQPSLTLPKIADLSPRELLAQTKELIAAVK